MAVPNHSMRTLPNILAGLLYSRWQPLKHGHLSPCTKSPWQFATVSMHFFQGGAAQHHSHLRSKPRHLPPIHLPSVVARYAAETKPYSFHSLVEHPLQTAADSSSWTCYTQTYLVRKPHCSMSKRITNRCKPCRRLSPSIDKLYGLINSQ